MHYTEGAYAGSAGSGLGCRTRTHTHTHSAIAPLTTTHQCAVSVNDLAHSDILPQSIYKICHVSVGNRQDIFVTKTSENAVVTF